MSWGLERADICGVTITLGWLQNGWSLGRGSWWKTSKIAPLIQFLSRASNIELSETMLALPTLIRTDFFSENDVGYRYYEKIAIKFWKPFWYILEKYPEIKFQGK